MSSLPVISLDEEILFLKSIVIPSFGPLLGLSSNEAGRAEWMRNKASKWPDANKTNELMDIFNTLTTLEKAEAMLAELKREKMQMPQVDQAAAAAVSVVDMKACVKEALQELRDAENVMELSISNCSSGRMQRYLTQLEVGLEAGDASDIEPAESICDPFQWTQQEDMDTPNACSHLQGQLTRFGIKFDRGEFALYDVHNKRGILTLQDRKTGHLKGGTDLIIAPHGLHENGLVQQCFVAVELKTVKAVADGGGLGSFSNQAILELIASNYFSYQMTVVLLTDLSTTATIFTLSKKQDSDSVNVKVYENLTISQAIQYVAKHLLKNCVPDAHYRLGTQLPEAARPAAETLQAFKRARVTPLEDSVVWEHFQDMLQDCAPGTRERADIINELYRAWDFPQPAFLSMYS